MNIVNRLLDINFTSGREGHNIKNIVLHTMGGTVNDRDAFFRSPDAKVSVHYGVGLDGGITEWVSDTDTALQTDNTQVNQESIGIICEDNGIPNDAVRSDALYSASAELVAELCKRYDVPCKLIEVDSSRTPHESGIVLHNQVSMTPINCPNGLDSNRILAQAQAILEPPGEPKPVIYEALPSPKKMRVKDMANGGAELWDLTFLDWADVKSVQHLNAGDEFHAVAVAHHPLGGEYYMSDADYNNSGQSDVPYMPWGANVDDLEDISEAQTTTEQPQQEQVTESAPNSEQIPATETALDTTQEQTSEAQVTPEVAPLPDPVPPVGPEAATAEEVVSQPEEEQISEPEPGPAEQEQLATETAAKQAPETTQDPDPTPTEPQITYCELYTPLDFVTNKAPTSVYALDTETFAKITVVKELAEGTPFKAINRAIVTDGDETTYYYVDDQNQAVNQSDVQPALAPQEQVQVPEPEAISEPEADPRATQKPLNEESLGQKVMDVLPSIPKLKSRFSPKPKAKMTPVPDNDWMQTYEDYDHTLVFTVKGNHQIEDLEGKLTKQSLPDKMPIHIAGHFTKDGQEYYLSEACAYPVDENGIRLVGEGNQLPRIWLGILPEYLTSDSDVDNLSNQVLGMSKKEKAIAGVGTFFGTPVGALRKLYLKTKKG